MWSATARIRSASPTEVPPNFWTTSGIRPRLQTAQRLHHGMPGRTRPAAALADRRPGGRSEAAPGLGRVAAVPSEKRARQRAAREARLAAEAKRQKRRQQIRNGVIVVVIAGVVVGHRLPRLRRRQQAGVRDPGGDHDDQTVATAATPRRRRRPTRPRSGRVPGEHQDHGQHPEVPSAPAMTIDTSKTYTATVKTTAGTFVISLDAKSAPKTVNNFVFLAHKGYYHCVIFHRVIPGFMDQTGDPDRYRARAARATITDANPAKAANPPAVPARVGGHGQHGPAQHRRQPVLHRGRAPGRVPAQHVHPLRHGHLGHERGRDHQQAGSERVCRPTSPSASCPSPSTSQLKEPDHGHPSPPKPTARAPSSGSSTPSRR